jgi:DNA-binding transcriptional MerR regulator
MSHSAAPPNGSEWSIQELARAARTTSRTLRHYGELGLLAPSRIGSNGYRYYDQDSLLRLHRILLLRELGLGLPAIGEVLAGQQPVAPALRTHLRLLRQERDRIGRQIKSVERTIQQVQGGEKLMAEQVFEGFDNSGYEDEVVQRWGQAAYDSSNRALTRLGKAGQAARGAEHTAIATALGQASAAGLEPGSDVVQGLVRRHHDWVSVFWTPGREAYQGLGRMYVDDPRFAATYDKFGEGTSVLLRDAIVIYAERNLPDGEPTR